ncbi:unnamed protein product, partial [Larinioides sclopetarius]
MMKCISYTCTKKKQCQSEAEEKLKPNLENNANQKNSMLFFIVDTNCSPSPNSSSKSAVLVRNDNNNKQMLGNEGII